jgi:glycine/D-amino acid oxidase-like deaminating enzyme
MDLRSGLPFSLIKWGLPFEYPKLEKSLKTDVIIMGGGISGALVAYYLVKEGIRCILIDKRTIGLGSTCASTTLLQYEIDVSLFQLIKKIGKQKAARAYHLGCEAIAHLKEIAAEIQFTDFEITGSLYFAERQAHIDFLRREFLARKNNGFDVAWLEQNELEHRFNLHSPAAIFSGVAAQTNAYMFTHFLLQHGLKRGLDVFDGTEAVSIQHENKGVHLRIKNGFTLSAKKLVYATGYEAVEYIDQNLVQLHSTYAMVSEQDESRDWNNSAVMWNTADPYSYLRSLKDHRILIGGRDVKFYNPVKRDKLIKLKIRQLKKDFDRFFPGCSFSPEYSWAGTFGTTRDGLPFIGTYKKLKHSYFALGFGGNGITFSEIAARIISELFNGKKNTDAGLFSFERI